MKRLEEILKWCDAATPGPWVTSDTACLSLRSDKTNDQIIGSVSVPYVWEHEWTASPEDIIFIAHARTDLPLVVKALQKAVKALGIIHEQNNCHEKCLCGDTLAEIEVLLGEKE